MADPLRFLLDQNFPEVDILDPHTVDRSVQYEHIRKWRPDLVAHTPDWLIYFEAELDGFAGVVTKDWRQSVQAEEAYALTHTKLVVVTWKEPPYDPIVEWAMVIAYMPEIKRLIARRHDPPFVFLPSPHLDARQIREQGDTLGILAAERGLSTAQVRQEARDSIIDHLTVESLREELFQLAKHKSTRQAPGSLLAPKPAPQKRPPADQLPA